MNCPCHGEPCYWQKDKRMTAGGRWECRVKRREFNATRQTNAARREALTQRRRDQYDTDWRFRIGTNLRKNAASRRRRLEARKGRLSEEEPDG